MFDINNHFFSDNVPLKLTLDVDIEHYNTNERPFNVLTAWHNAILLYIRKGLM